MSNPTLARIDCFVIAALSPKKAWSANRLLLFTSHLKIAGFVKVAINTAAAAGVLYQGWCHLVKMCCQISTIH